MTQDTRRLRKVNAAVGVVTGSDSRQGIGVNWGYLGLDPEVWPEFVADFLSAMGFPEGPVPFERNADGDPRKTNWNRIRIKAEECEIYGVSPAVAVRGGREWLSGDGPKRYGLRFVVAKPQST